MKLPLILDYEIYDEDGPCAPYFTGRITDADGRIMCRAENEELAAELVDHVSTILARHNALREAVKREIKARDNYSYYRSWELAYDHEVNAAYDEREAARAEVDRLVAEEEE